MWLKFLIVSVAVALATADDPPRKLYRVRDDQEPVSPLTDPFDNLDYRLPNTTIPIRYDVYLTTDVHKEEFEFSGRVIIQILALQNTPNITLHYRQLTISNVNLATAAGGLIEASVPTSKREDVEFLIITPSQPLVMNQIYVVEILYSGILRNDDAGFYRSSYVNALGQTKWLATTQFESTDARHAFPCYDEPAIRSRYSIEIRHHNSYTAISNMPQASRTSEAAPSEYVVTKFAEIPSVQSYLIAFTVSDFTSVEDTSGVIPQRIFGRPQSISNGEGAYALEVSGKILTAFENYLGVNYSLPKMDQAAIPDFAAGAMENWGLVTYAEPYLLFNENTGTTGNREGVLLTIAHEFAHQWFGNFISPAWWSYLWLNEGFATLFENHLTSIVYPNERWIDTFLIDTVQPVMENDANPSIRPMTYYVESPERIDNLFDNVAYSKAGSVLKMFQNVFGDSTWSKGLNMYLNERAWNLATSDHLYQGIQRAVDQDYPTNTPNVAAIMRTWETQSGLPVVMVSRSGTNLKFEQKRFFYTNQTSENLWWIPINYVVGSSPDFSSTKPDLWIQGTSNLTISNSSAPKAFAGNEWIVVNAQQSGYYRVNYDNDLWDLIIEQLNKDGNEFNKIHLLNRAQLIDDSFHLARAGVLDFDTIFEIMNYLEKETDFIPWATTNRAHTLLNRWLTGTAVYPKYQEFMKKNVQALFNRLGTNIVANEPRVDRYARTIAINIGCQNQLPACLTQTTQKLQAMIDSGNALAPDLVNSVYCSGLRMAAEPLFTAMKNKMLQSTSQSEKNTIIASLGCTHNATLLESYLGLVVDASVTLTLNEKSRILTSSLNIGETSIRTLMTFTRNNAAALTSAGLITSTCSNIASRVASQESLEQFITLLGLLRGANQLTEAQFTSYRNSADTIMNWQTANLGPIIEFFGVDDPLTTSTTEGAGSVALSTAILALCFVIKQLF